MGFITFSHILIKYLVVFTDYFFHAFVRVWPSLLRVTSRKGLFTGQLLHHWRKCLFILPLATATPDLMSPFSSTNECWCLVQLCAGKHSCNDFRVVTTMSCLESVFHTLPHFFWLLHSFSSSSWNVPWESQAWVLQHLALLWSLCPFSICSACSLLSLGCSFHESPWQLPTSSNPTPKHLPFPLCLSKQFLHKLPHPCCSGHYNPLAPLWPRAQWESNTIKTRQLILFSGLILALQGLEFHCVLQFFFLFRFI